MHLVTTAQREYWPESGPIWLLSPGCSPDIDDDPEVKGNWEIKGIVSDPFQNDREITLAYAEIWRIADVLIGILAQRLNIIHNTDHSERYWRTHIGFWALLFVTAVYDRYARLLKARSEIEHIKVIGCHDANWVVVPDTLNFVYEASGDHYNCQIYTFLCNKLGIPVFERSADNFKSKPEKILDIKSSHVKRGLKRAAGFGYAVLASIFAQRADVLMVSSMLPRRFETALSLATGGAIFPLYTQTETANCSNSSLNVKARADLSVVPEGCDEVMALAVEMVKMCLPKIFVENYQELCVHSDHIYKQYQPEAIYSANAWWFDEPFKHWAAKCQEQGTKLIGGAHGSAYFVRKHGNPEEFEALLVDHYLTWGWGTPSRPKLIPAPACKLVDLDVRPNRISGEGVLYGGTVEARHNVVPLADFSVYLEWQRRFFAATPPSFISMFLVRLHYADYGWKMKDRLIRIAPNLQFDNWETRFSNRLKSCRIYVCDHLSTTYAEALAANVPTVLFWNEAKYPICEAAKPYIQALKDCCVLHDTPESAAQWVVRIYDDPAPWWSSDSCQKAVKDFCYLYSRTSETPLKEWKGTLSKLLTNL